jgi:hypothetical protein
MLIPEYDFQEKQGVRMENALKSESTNKQCISSKKYVNRSKFKKISEDSN